MPFDEGHNEDHGGGDGSCDPEAIMFVATTTLNAMGVAAQMADVCPTCGQVNVISMILQIMRRDYPERHRRIILALREIGVLDIEEEQADGE